MKLFFALTAAAMVFSTAGVPAVRTVSAADSDSKTSGIPESARLVPELKSDTADFRATGNLLYVIPRGPSARRTVRMPRIANSVVAMTRPTRDAQPINLKPDLTEWLLEPVSGAPDFDEREIIFLELDGPLRLMTDDLTDRADEQGIIHLPASHAITEGEKLRFEPQSHKNTVGYWTNEKDTARWRFQVTKPGRYELDILQGCGLGHGGSEVHFEIGRQTLPMIVQETGHFQNFVWRTIGAVDLTETENATLKIVPRKKAAAAVMDVREVRLVPVGVERAFEPQLADPKALPPVE